MILAKFKNIEELKYENLFENLREWKEHFKNLIGFNPWSLQEMWARRIFLNRSFTIIAPTGIGKTTFGLSISTFIKEKSYIILPTKLLVRQVSQKIKNWGYKKEILAVIESDEEIKEKIKNGNFKILITTSMFLYKNFNIIPRDIKFFFVDDVDAFLKTAKNIDKILYLMGFDEETINKTFELIKLKSKKNKTDEDFKKIEEIHQLIQDKKKSINSVLVVSSATASPKSQRVKLFRELLDFEIGKPTFYLRNVVDVWTNKHSDNELINYVKNFKKGGLIFISSDKGKEEVNRIVELLKRNGIKAESYENLDEKLLKQFENGKIEVLVGISSYRNPLSRGIDIPSAIRYAIFYGVPKIIVKLDITENQNHLIWALASIRTKVEDKRIDNWLKKLKKMKSEDENLKKEILEFLLSKEIQKIIKESDEISFNGNNLIVADIVGYLQASGRTSRLYAGGISKGLSLILVDDQKALNNLFRKARWFVNDINFLNEKEVDYNKIFEEIDKDRKIIKDIIEKKVFGEIKDVLKPIFIIVESPNKARTIANFFGKPIRRKVLNCEIYEIPIGEYYISITASFGHILDLVKDEGIHGVIKNSQFIPIYEPIEGKENLIKSLRLVSLEYDNIFIATDPDTEGEKIAWDLYNLLNFSNKNINRMEFHEITKRAIMKALNEPRSINENLTKAQIVRRIADRWVGFELSQLVQKKFKNNKLSAGRVQTPVLGWIIERFNESKRKIPIVSIYLNNLKIDFEFENKKLAQEFYKLLENVKIEKISEEIKEINPLPPFRTDTLLKEAGEKFKFSPQKTMSLAQDLFEFGLITYHRTDSIRVSDVGINLAKEFIIENYKEQNLFSGRTWGEGGAHECIRPTRNLSVDDLKSLISIGEITNLNFEHVKLYDLIFKRFIASQMKSVKVKIIKYRIKAIGYEKELELNSEIIENGFNLILPIKTYHLSDGIYEINEDEKFFKLIPSKYPHTYSTIVAMMKERGIGRPSTYSTIIEKLLERNYVYEKNGFLIPTKLGILVYNFLNSLKEKEFFIKEEFTRELEKIMDNVEEGTENYQNVLLRIYENLFNISEKFIFN